MPTSNLNYKTWLNISILMLVFGIGVGFIGFPRLLHSMIKGQINTAPGSNIRPIYEKLPFFLNFRLHIFNITNKEEVLEGKKPTLQEVGPYTFEEWKDKYDIVDNDEEDTITYHGRVKYIFRPDLSGPGLTGNEIVVMVHPMLMGMLMATSIDKESMLPNVEQAAKNMFHDPSDAFYTGRVMDVLFDGVLVDCSSDDKVTQSVCLTFDGSSSFIKVDDNHYKFSLFGASNYSDGGEFKVYRGKNNYKNTGRVISYNGDDEFNFYEVDECNQFRGTDQSVFPAFMPLDDGVYLFESPMCRSLAAVHQGHGIFNGIPYERFEIDPGNELNVNPCYCREEDKCLPKGMIDLFRCTGIPTVVTLPHFYLAEAGLEGIESGLNPDKDKHTLFLHFEIVTNEMTGSLLSVARRAQFNLDVKPLPQTELMKNMPEVIFPMFWLEEQVDVPQDLTDQLKHTIFRFIKIMDVLKWICTIGGLLGCVLCGITMVMA